MRANVLSTLTPFRLAAFCLVAVAAAVAAAAATPAQAQPVPAAERIPVDIRRTTFVVRDIDKSLALYRDALGLKLIYDQLIGGGVDKDGKARAPSVRLVLLRANDIFIGNLGLMQRLQASPAPEPADPAEPERPPEPVASGAGLAGRAFVSIVVSDPHQ